MKINKVTIRMNETGWVVYFGNDVENFLPFLSTEPERFVKFLSEKVAGIKVDALLAARQAEINLARLKLDEAEKAR